MRHQLLRPIGAVAVIALAALTMARVNCIAQTSTPGFQPPAAQNAAPAPKTPWGEPDLQGIWSVELLVPMERPAGVTAEFYTEEEVAELDGQRAGKSVFGNHLRDRPRSEADVSGAYNAVFTSQRPTSRRTAMNHRSTEWETASVYTGGARAAGRVPGVSAGPPATHHRVPGE